MFKPHRARSRRLLAVTGAVALAGSLLPGAALASDHDGPQAPGSRGIDRVCPAENPVADAPTLDDIEDTTHEAAISCAVDYGFAGGFTDGTFRPNQAITRGQAASIATQLIERATGETLPAPAESDFSDVEGTTHEVAIDKLAEAGVVQGRAGGVFDPNDDVTRGQMTRIIANAIDVADSGVVDGSRPEADANEYFADAVGSTFQANIQALAGIGVVQGRTATEFEANAAVTRGQMAAFVMRGADFLDREQRFQPTAEIVEFDVTLAGENEVSMTDGSLGAGELNTTATATITVDAFNGEFDYQLNFADVTGPFDAEGTPGFHIHEGGLAENGGIVAFLADGDAVQAAANDGMSVLTGTFLEEDAADGFRFADLVADPDSYYLNLHSDLFPAGAVRGQLPEGGQDLLASETFMLTLTDEAEVDPFVGEAGATATATIEVDPVARTITHSTDFGDVTGPFDGDGSPGYHIHVGADDENGPVVLFLATAAELQAAADDDNIVADVIEDVDPALLRQLIRTPENYYVNLHSDMHPGGAVRAQFS